MAIEIELGDDHHKLLVGPVGPDEPEGTRRLLTKSGSDSSETGCICDGCSKEVSACLSHQLCILRELGVDGQLEDLFEKKPLVAIQVKMKAEARRDCALDGMARAI